MRTILISLFVILTLCQFCFAQFDYGFEFSKAGSAGLQFLKIGTGAQHTGMAGAVSAIVNDASSVFWNPAGIAAMENRQVFFSYSNWLVNSKHAALAAALPVGSFHVGLSIISLNIEDFEETTVLSPTGTGRMVGAGDILVGISVAKQFTDKLSIGGQVKFVQEKLDNTTFENILFDIGTIYHTGFRDLRLAFTLQHFGPDKIMIDKKFKMPLLFRVGIADNVLKTEDLRLTTAVDLVHPTDNKEWVNFGLEFMYLESFAIRTGYRLNIDEGKLTFGFGLNSPAIYDIKPKFNYSYSSFGEIFGAIHRFSLGFDF